MELQTYYRFLIFLILHNHSSRANDLGREFITGFMQNTNSTEGANNLKLIITAFSGPTSVNINITSTSTQWTVSLQEGETRAVTVPQSAEMIGSARFPSSILITSDKDISVVSVSEKLQSAGTAVLLPVSKLGTQYYVLTPTGTRRCSHKQFSVINHKFSNKVILSFRQHVTFTEDMYVPKKKLVLTLEPYQALQLQSQEDLSGTKVVSEMPVAVLSGHTCMWQGSMCDHVYEQLPPVSRWKKSFLVPPLVAQYKSDSAYVLAGRKSTQLRYVSGHVKYNTKLERGEVLEILVKPLTPVFISASEPIQVFYYHSGGISQSQQVGSFFISLSGTSEFCKSYNVYGLANFENSAALVANTSASGGVTLDDQPLSNIQWRRIPGTDYSWAVVNFDTARNSHTLKHPGAAFEVLNIGTVTQRAYGTSAICTEAYKKPSCTSVTCSADEMCKMMNERPTCIKIGDSSCIAWGVPHYITFDGRAFDFESSCSHTMVQNCGTNSTLPVFNVQAKTENRGLPHISYISMVTVHTPGYTIEMVRSEYGLARVNNQRGPLPISLNNGTLKVYQQGQYAVLETSYGLQVLYDWKTFIIVKVPPTFHRNVCGMCGNNNQDPTDDFMMPSGEQAANATQLGSSWKTNDTDADCSDDCSGVCPDVSAELAMKYEALEFCGLLADNTTGPFRLCYPQINPLPFLKGCVRDLSLSNGYQINLCQTFTTYAVACHNRGIQTEDWRSLSGCDPECPLNSIFKTCGSACPETCVQPTVDNCSRPCVETCECNEDFVLSEGACIPESECGCYFEGRSYAPKAKFWKDDCQKECFCNSESKNVECKTSKCRTEEVCGTRNGILDCYPVGNSTCLAVGDPHYSTFDGLRYNFMGTCVYLFSGLCQLYTGLEDFEVYVQNDKRSSKTVSYTKMVEVKVYENEIVINKEFPRRVTLNGLLINLPYTVANGKIEMYRKGRTAVIETDFGLKVTFDWWSHLSLTIPSTYSKSVCGLCGNFDSDKKNDLTIRGDSVVSKPTAFGNSWKKRDVEGCQETPLEECANKESMLAQQKENKTSCGILLDLNGPFHDCHSRVDPEGFFQDCVYDFCFYKGMQKVFCQMVASYVLACQEAGVKVHQWRNDSFCRINCPKNSHYEICARGCGKTCSDLFNQVECNAKCKEGCVCDDGFLLSDDKCVPISRCGCSYKGVYYKAGATFYPEDNCNTQCVCKNSGGVKCKAHSCGFNEACQVVDGVRRCYAVGTSTCSAYGNLHLWTFDKVAYDLQGICSYILAESCSDNSNLEPFSVRVGKEKRSNMTIAVTKLVTVAVYGVNITLMQGEAWVITVSGVLYTLPFNLPERTLCIYQKGIKIIVETDFGLKVTYDLASHITVTAPGNYMNQTCGLCGRYNGDKNSKFMLADNTLAPDAATFASAWTLQLPGMTCNSGCGTSGSACQVCDQKSKEVYKQSQFCGILVQPGGPFSACHSMGNANLHLARCIFDLCQTNGDRSILCHSIQSYALECEEMGAPIKPWRSQTFCPMTCPENSHYLLRADVCSTSCAYLTDTAECPRKPLEGCQCSDGFFSDGKLCVPLNNCGCFYKGLYFKAGQEYLLEGCQEKCTCSSSAGVSCVPYNCSTDKCEVQDGARVCLNAEKKCPQNSHYELCGSGCPLTCSGPSSPAGCDAPCTEGCFCDRGFLLSGDKCVPVEDCGCVQNNTYYPTGQNFYLGDTCTSRCNCNKNGTLDCQASSCGANELCKVANGVRGCYPAEVSQCVATGDPHYRSFDGWSFEFQGTCTYILAQLQSNLPQVPNFSVTVKNERYGTTSASVAKTVMVIVDRYNITLDRGIRWKVKVNDLLYVLPLKLSPRDIQINQEGNNIIIVTSFGLKVLYDAMYYIRVEVPSTWKGQMRGLCGNFNGDRNDDFQLPNGGRASNVDDFGAAWQVDVKEANCSRGCGNNCPTCSAANTQKYSSSLSCGMIKDPSGPFRLCHGQVNPTDYLNFCLYDLCSVTDQTDLLCKNLQAYAAACQAAGTKVMPWRSATFCPLACPSKSHYDLCTSTCGETCASVTESSKCSGQCFEGCSCDSGFMFDGESCVPRDNCGCVYNGQYIPRGESVVSADCSKQCTCMSGKVGVQCSEYGCDRGSVCTVNDGLRGCYIQYIQCTFPLEAIVSTIGNVSKISFDLSHTCTTKNPYYYTLMVNYDPTIQPGGIAIAYIKKGFTSELRSNQQVKVNNAIAKLPYTDSNGLAIKTVEDGLMLDQASVLRLTLSFNGTVALAVNPTIDACGPCTDSKNTAISSIQVVKLGQVKYGSSS